MWNKKAGEKTGKSSQKLSREILGIFGGTFFFALFCFYGLNEIANQIILRYMQEGKLVISEYQLYDIQYAILGISFVSAIILFVLLFLFLVGERLAYIREVVKGIEALERHEWDYEIPLRGKNELTELAGRVNELSKAEAEFQAKEKRLQEEKISLMRSLSHDIRTPLTSMMSYSEYMKQKDCLSDEEIKAYMELVEQKSKQIKVLTDQLLDGGSRKLEFVEDGRLLLQQLVDEWSLELEESFDLRVDLDSCPAFSGKYNIEELRRIFDNLASNIQKYADSAYPVLLQIEKTEGGARIWQSNHCKEIDTPVESRKIGIESIRKIMEQYGGTVEFVQKDEIFRISLELPFL